MRPFRSRVMAALVMAILLLGLLGTVANAHPITATGFPEDPWDHPQVPSSDFPEDPWPGLN